MRLRITILIMLIAVISLGTLRTYSRSKVVINPIHVDFCFLLKNTTQFYDRTVISSAHLVRSIHGEALWSPNCSEGILTFRIVDHDANTAALDAAVFNHRSSAEVPITFVATIDRPSKLDALRVSLLRRFGIAAKYREDIKIEKVLLSGLST